MLYFSIVALRASGNILSKAFYERHENVPELLLISNRFLAKNSGIEHLLSSISSCSETNLFISDDLYLIRLGWRMRLTVRYF